MVQLGPQNLRGRMLLLLLAAVCLLPFAVASVPLVWFSVGDGSRWAHSLFHTEHPLNFGGNPDEVFSHLLNIIVMSGSITSLCLGLLCAIWSQSLRFENSSVKVELLLSVSLIVSVLMLWGWATYLDGRSGEGTVGLAFIMFFAPAIFLSRMAAQGLITSPRSRFPRVLTIFVLWAISVGMIWLYEPSGTGGPNILVFPLLALQVGLFWFASRKFGHRHLKEPQVMT